MKATFENSVNVLVKAYFNDTLQHGSCSACAVGNLIADSMGFTFEKMDRDIDGFLMWDQYDHAVNLCRPNWQLVFQTSPRGNNRINETSYKGDSKIQIDSTGYTWRQLAIIEYKFERATGNTKDERMFNGLMAVVDVLAEIHGVSLEVKESAKLQFVKA